MASKYKVVPESPSAESPTERDHVRPFSPNGVDGDEGVPGNVQKSASAPVPQTKMRGFSFDRTFRKKKKDYMQVHSRKKVTDMNQQDNTPLKIAGLLVILYILGGTFYYSRVVGWSVVDGIYFTIVTLTTVGYGDITPKTDGQKVFTCLFVFCGVGMIGNALGILGSILLDKQQALEEHLDKKVDQLTTGDDFMTPSRWKLVMSFLLIVVLVFGGTITMMIVEGMSFVDGMYYSCVTVTTVGYGDITPKTDPGKIFAFVYLTVGTVVIAKVLGDIANVPLEARQMRLEKEVLEQFGSDLTVDELKELAAGGEDDDFCTEAEFIIGMLLKINKVQPKDVERCIEQFKKLDIDGSGRLTMEDVEMHKERSVKNLNAENNGNGIP